MQKTVYYSKKYLARQAAGANSSEASVMVQAPARRSVKLGGMVLVACLVLAVLMAVIVPFVVDGAIPASAAAQGRTAGQANAQEELTAVEYDTLEGALESLKIQPSLPDTQALGLALTGCRVVNGAVLELDLSGESGLFCLRVAAGKDDLSGQDPESFAFHAAETVGQVTRSYMGSTEDSLRVAVWAARGYSYAIVANSPVSAQAMHQLAEGIK